MIASNPANTSNLEDVCFVNFGASKHMRSHEDWFRDLRKPERPGYVETGDDTIHPIQHVGNVPFDEEGNHTYIKNVLHVPAITKNLDSVDHIMEQRMQVRFNAEGASSKRKVKLSPTVEEKVGCSS